MAKKKCKAKIIKFIENIVINYAICMVMLGVFYLFIDFSKATIDWMFGYGVIVSIFFAFVFPNE